MNPVSWLAAGPTLPTTLLDGSLNDQDYIVFQSGKHDESVKIKLSDYKELVEPRVLTFSYHLH